MLALDASTLENATTKGARAGMKKAIFIDRDGTLIDEVSYLRMLEDLRFTPRAAEALRTFHNLGYLNIVITNQSAVARGLLSPKALNKIHNKLKLMAKEEDAMIHDIFFCPHFPEGRVAPFNIECDCRKPKPGMLHQAAAKHKIDLQQSILIGDKSSDLQLAKNVDARPVLVLTGSGSQTKEIWQEPVESFPNLYEFSKYLREQEAERIPNLL
jgi:D-glycero-D-manno-heptose 1,7-bisphosphate phosphatase